MRDLKRTVFDTYNRIADAYTAKYFDDHTDEVFLDRLTALLHAGAAILDAGSGPGQFSNYLLDCWFAVTGVDASKRMLQIARARVPKGQFEYGDFRHLRFADGSFDAIVSAHALHHIPSAEVTDVLREWRRVLKPGGKLLVFVYGGEPDQLITEPFDQTHQIFINLFTTARLRDALTKTGFATDFIEEHVGGDTGLGHATLYALATVH